jgi:hypothetical protein
LLSSFKKIDLFLTCDQPLRMGVNRRPARAAKAHQRQVATFRDLHRQRGAAETANRISTPHIAAFCTIS